MDEQELVAIELSNHEYTARLLKAYRRINLELERRSQATVQLIAAESLAIEEPIEKQEESVQLHVQSLALVSSQVSAKPVYRNKTSSIKRRLSNPNQMRMF